MPKGIPNNPSTEPLQNGATVGKENSKLIQLIAPERWQLISYKSDNGFTTITEGIAVSTSMPEGVILKVTEKNSGNIATALCFVPNIRLKEVIDQKTGMSRYDFNKGN